MKRCAGPCCGLIEPEAYAELVEGTALFLRGRSAELVEDLEGRMRRAAEAERFEDAARIRDRLTAVERTVERQQIVGERAVDRDVFGLAREGGDAQVQVLHVRDGRLMGTQGYELADVELDDGDLMTSFLSQFYAPADRGLPREVLTAAHIDDDGALEALLAERASRRVSLRKPRRGAGRELVRLANANAELGLLRRIDARESLETALQDLQQRLGLRGLPRRIEGYDVSTLHGTLTVASRVVFEDGKPSKNDYRRYRIREAAPDDDYACMREVLTRRLARAETEPLPDVLMVDGGKGQLAVLVAALADAEADVDAISLAKERDEASASPRVRRSGGLKAERVFLPNRKDPITLPPSSKALLLLQRVRDESHRFAIEFQRSLRSKLNFTSILEELPGIGPTKKRTLLKHFGSLRGVRDASLEALAAVSGIGARDAATLRRFFDATDAAREYAGTGDPAGREAGPTATVPDTCERIAPQRGTADVSDGEER
jgi:excinuclease ABC subunit C